MPNTFPLIKIRYDQWQCRVSIESTLFNVHNTCVVERYFVKFSTRANTFLGTYKYYYYFFFSYFFSQFSIYISYTSHSVNVSIVVKHAKYTDLYTFTYIYVYSFNFLICNTLLTRLILIFSFFYP